MTPSPLQARRKQLNRLEREERLGALQIELANNKTKRLSQLRAFARVVRGGPSSYYEPAVAGPWLRQPCSRRLHSSRVPIHASDLPAHQPCAQLSTLQDVDTSQAALLQARIAWLQGLRRLLQ